jgi:putative peptidoglycan lipid II flippase
MAEPKKNPLLSGTIVTSAGTLTSRVLGLLRDMATAALFGLAAGGILDALVIAFRIPNLFRALFGEGALTASFLPVFSAALERDRSGAWQLFSAVMKWLAVLLCIIVVMGEIGLAVWLWLSGDSEHVALLAGLSLAMLPYLVVVCLTAINGAALQALGRFAAPAFAPAVLNIAWIVGAIVIAPLISSDPAKQAYVLAACVMFGGLLQWAVLWPETFREGFRFERAPRAAVAADTLRRELKLVRRNMIPTTLSLAVTQLNTLSDSIVAWAFAAPREGSQTIAWLGGARYPMEQGAAAAIYFGERLYQFPLGLIGIAAATVVFPLLSKHAVRNDRAAIGRDLTLGLRMVFFVACPCAVGLVVLAEPISRLLFEHGKFTEHDVLRTARMVAVYGAGVWAYCMLPVLVRGFYSLDDRIRPLRIGLAAVALNIVLDFTLIWFWAEAGLAAATAISAAVQATTLAAVFSRRHVMLNWPALLRTIGFAVATSALMALAGWLAIDHMPVAGGGWNSLLRVAVPMAVCVVVYAAATVVFGRKQWRELYGRR